ncbi:stage II sporulation protein AA (anti-sigma F factor antagonist) [Herbaspirillum sp. 1173]|uniref:STAS domain-containing protein n=1 Tax=Herbaspirillum sp. 1173 TaxID=2817734 RepID=UPI0028601816|nr:STAS domain-containing protein [Herbaspirillum sp. 1173]MDR6739175.1 stage II sporulation protein AA (anti-sigma F factor antagonist) [Herbaspirillum sp. 1173]
MNITFEKAGEILEIGLEGKISSVNAGQFEADIMAQVARGESDLLVDMRALDYISSAGLRVVLLVAKKLKQTGGVLALYGMQSQIREVFDISGFLGILNVSDTREQALQHFPHLD